MAVYPCSTVNWSRNAGGRNQTSTKSNVCANAGQEVSQRICMSCCYRSKDFEMILSFALYTM